MKLKFNDLFELKKDYNCSSLAGALQNVFIHRNSDYFNYIETTIYKELPKLKFDSNGYCVFDGLYDISFRETDLRELSNSISFMDDIVIHRILKYAYKKNRQNVIIYLLKDAVFKKYLKNVLVINHFPKTIKFVDRIYNMVFKDFKPELVYPVFETTRNIQTYKLLSRYPINLGFKKDFSYFAHIDIDDIKQVSDFSNLRYLWSNHSREVLEYALKHFNEKLINESLSEYIEPTDTAFELIYNRINYEICENISLRLITHKYKIYYILQRLYDRNLRFYNYRFNYTPFLDKLQLPCGSFQKEYLRPYSLIHKINESGLRYYKCSPMKYYLLYKLMKHCVGISSWVNIQFATINMLISPIFTNWDESYKSEYIKNFHIKVGSDMLKRPGTIKYICTRQKEQYYSAIQQLLHEIPFDEINHSCNKEFCILLNYKCRNIKNAKSI